MCCAVSHAQFEKNLFQNESSKECFPAVNGVFHRENKKSRKLSKTTVPGVKKEMSIVPQKDESGINSAPCDCEEAEKTEKEKKKKKKWKAMSLSDTGFSMSLFPRPTRPEIYDPEEEERIFAKIEREQAEYDNVLSEHTDFGRTCGNILHEDGRIRRKDKFFRSDRDRKVTKASKQVKTKYCRNLRNNDGRKKLFIHHRLFKLINLEEKRLNCHLPSPKYHNLSTHNNKSTDETRSKLKPFRAPAAATKPAPVQNLRHTLHATTAPTDIASDLVSVLVNIQHRELTPEDYELLLRLDERVKPKTIDKSTLEAFKTDTVTADTAGDICAVCMDPYEVGQTRKFLPCDHFFHDKCIDMWLENSSRNCPIDGLPIDKES